MRRGLLFLIAALGAAGMWAYARQDPDAALAAQAEVIRAVTAEDAGSLQSQPLAGLSALGLVAVEPLGRKVLGGDTLTPAYHHYRHRCASCHALPSPALHTAEESSVVVDRMQANLAAAGLLGIGPEERQAVLELLGRHARRP